MSVRQMVYVLAFACLSACGTAGDAPLTGIAGSIAANIGTAAKRDGGAGDDAVARQLTRSALDRATQPLLLAELPSREARATLVTAGQNRAHVTWVSADGIGLTLKNGILTGTRGLGPDLMAADIAASEPVLRRGSGAATRRYGYLDGENQIVFVALRCRYLNRGQQMIEIVERTFATRKVTEICLGDGLRFENHYWFAVSDGFTWRSTQWIGPEVGSITLTQLVRS